MAYIGHIGGWRDDLHALLKMELFRRVGKLERERLPVHAAEELIAILVWLQKLHDSAPNRCGPRSRPRPPRPSPFEMENGGKHKRRERVKLWQDCFGDLEICSVVSFESEEKKREAKRSGRGGRIESSARQRVSCTLRLPSPLYSPLFLSPRAFPHSRYLLRGASSQTKRASAPPP